MNQFIISRPFLKVKIFFVPDLRFKPLHSSAFSLLHQFVLELSQFFVIRHADHNKPFSCVSVLNFLTNHYLPSSFTFSSFRVSSLFLQGSRPLCVLDSLALARFMPDACQCFITLTCFISVSVFHHLIALHSLVPALEMYICMAFFPFVLSVCY